MRVLDNNGSGTTAGVIAGVDWITATHTGNGTSFAAPHVAGAAAVHLTNHPGASPAAVGSALVNGATSNVLTGIGSGSPDKLLRLVP